MFSHGGLYIAIAASVILGLLKVAGFSQLQWGIMFAPLIMWGVLVACLIVKKVFFDKDIAR